MYENWFDVKIIELPAKVKQFHSNPAEGRERFKAVNQNILNSCRTWNTEIRPKPDSLFIYLSPTSLSLSDYIIHTFNDALKLYLILNISFICCHHKYNDSTAEFRANWSLLLWQARVQMELADWVSLIPYSQLQYLKLNQSQNNTFLPQFTVQESMVSGNVIYLTIVLLPCFVTFYFEDNFNPDQAQI